MPRRDGHVLTVDVGTSATRVSAVSLSGEPIAASRVPCRPSIDGDRAVIDAEQLWSDVQGALRDVMARAGEPIAIAVASQLGTVFVDPAMRPVVPAMLWQDRRAAVEADELRRTLGARANEIGGRPVAPESTAARSLWMRKHEPDAWARVRHVLALKDFIVARATGCISTDPASASYTLLFDVGARQWSPELAAAAGIPLEHLPPVAAAVERAGGIDERVAAATGISAGVPVAIGGPDGSVAVLGSGVTASGMTVDVAGSTDVVLAVRDGPLVDPRGRAILNAFLLPELWTVGGPTGMTGGAFGWLCAVLGHSSLEDAYRRLEGALRAIPPGSDGVTFRTSLSGERFPTWSSDRSGSIAGLGPQHTSAHLLRAAEEGGAFVVREGLEALGALGVDVREVRMSGGVTRGRAAVQLRADVWRRPVVAVSNAEATTVGAAMLASVCGGAHRSIGAAAAAMVRLEPAVLPRDGPADAYDVAYRRWRASA